MNWDASGLILGVRAGLPDSRRLSTNQHPFSKPRTLMIQLLQTGMPPSNLSFLIAAFVVTGVIFLAYIFFVFKRRQESQRGINRLLRTIDEERNAADCSTQGEDSTNSS